MKAKAGIIMTEEESAALEESIKTWTRRLNGERIPEGRENCALCVLSVKRSGNESCYDCIIRIHTGDTDCHNTPYSNRGNDNWRQDELDFLKSLRIYRPKKEIKVGDIVKCVDGSFSIKIGSKELESTGDICSGKKYIVMATGCVLPEAGSHKGLFGNNTIIQESTTKEFFFSQRRFLRLIPKKEYCSECGKEK